MFGKKCLCLSVLLPVLLAARVFSGYGASGWTIFNKTQSSQFDDLSAFAPRYGDISGVLFNPAVQVSVKSNEISFLSEAGSVEDKFNMMIVETPGNKGTLSYGFAYYDSGLVDLNWIENGEIKTDLVTAQKDLLGFFSYSFRFKNNLYMGTTAKFASSQLAESESAYAFAADFGMFYTPLENLSFSFALQNIGKATKFIAVESTLPMSAYAGSGYLWQFGNSYLISALGISYLVNETKIIPSIGLQFGYGLFSANVGYKLSGEELSIQLGIQMAYKNTIFGYSLIPGGNLNPSNRFSISYKY